MIEKIWIVFSVALWVAVPAMAADAPVPAETAATVHEAAAKTEPVPSPGQASATTHHSIQVNGETLSYTATAGLLHVADAPDDPGADVFFVAYVKDDETDPAHRPITFAFNGGPGASSVWLHMGFLGPKRVKLADPGQPSPPPYTLVDNEFTWLDRTDLVVVDPVGTGFSRAVVQKGKEGHEASYYGVKADVRSVSEFIRLYITRYHRWNSPKFLAGESYGTVRAVLLANRLLDRYGMSLNGLILISAALDFQTMSPEAGNDLPYVMFLPTYALTASFHGKATEKRPTSVPEMGASAEQFALETYYPLLLKGDSLPANERKELIEQLSTMTGLSSEYLDEQDLRVDNREFARKLLRKEHRTLGILDGRFAQANEKGELFWADPSLVSTVTAYVAAFNDYVQRDLDYKNDTVYEYLSKEANRKWDWKTGEQGYFNVLDDLAEIMKKTPKLRIFVASGYYDLNTPYFGTKYCLNHLGISPGLQKNIEQMFYLGGHQMYIEPNVASKLKGDIQAFISVSTSNNKTTAYDNR